MNLGLPPNGWRYPSRSTPAERPGKGGEGWWAGREDATLPESTSSHSNAPKTRRVPPAVPEPVEGSGARIVSPLYVLKSFHGLSGAEIRS
jgi:hypothetical protein